MICVEYVLKDLMTEYTKFAVVCYFTLLYFYLPYTLDTLECLGTLLIKPGGNFPSFLKLFS